MKSGKEKSIDDYISIEIWYRLFGWIVCFIIFFVILYVAFQFNIQFFVFAIFMIVFIMLLIFRDMTIIYHKKKIKDYVVEQGLINKIGKILYWYCHENCSCYHHDFVLTDNYIIVLYKKEIVSFRYEDIVSIKMKESYQHCTNSLHQKNELYVSLKDGREIIIVVYDGDSVARIKDISTILLEKNNKIKVEDSEIGVWYKAYFS